MSPWIEFVDEVWGTFPWGNSKLALLSRMCVGVLRAVRGPAQIVKIS